MPLNPFAPATSKPGYGVVNLALLPASRPVLETVSYQYPLKLIAPTPILLPDPPNPCYPHGQHTSPDQQSHHAHHQQLIHTIYVLTYGGGLVAGDRLHLTLHLAATTRLILLTQGSTKIFLSPHPHSLISTQTTTAHLAPGSALVYLPDPAQPFADSAFRQRNVYHLAAPDASLCALDWVCAGRVARGECWKFAEYASRTEVWAAGGLGQSRLLLRDSLVLDARAPAAEPLGVRMRDLGVVGTLVLHGPLFAGLAEYVLSEFAALPRLGGRRWDGEDEDADGARDQNGTEGRRKRAAARQSRLLLEQKEGVLWTAARVRARFVVVKFGAPRTEGARAWLRSVIEHEGSVESVVGERAMLCLK